MLFLMAASPAHISSHIMCACVYVCACVRACVCVRASARGCVCVLRHYPVHEQWWQTYRHVQRGSKRGIKLCVVWYVVLKFDRRFHLTGSQKFDVEFLARIWNWWSRIFKFLYIRVSQVLYGRMFHLCEFSTIIFVLITYLICISCFQLNKSAFVKTALFETIQHEQWR